MILNILLLLFVQKKKYWCGTSGQRQIGDEEMEMNGHIDHDSFERNPQGIHAGIKIRQLRKVIRIYCVLPGNFE